jgi:ADP-heptose:LPS heptosyltransferase
MKLMIGIKMLNFEKTYKLPFKFHIPNYTLDFLIKQSLKKRNFKFLKRSLFILFKQQKNLEVYRILPEHKKILWINVAASSLGDSLMDLSSRVLIQDRVVDLFTDTKNANLYKNDLVFNSIFTKKNQVNSFDYDLVIIDSFGAKSINIKANIASQVNYVGMFGFYNGPEVNRVLFSFHRLNQLLGYSKNEIEINSVAKCSLEVSRADKSVVLNSNLPSNYIAIALGGEWNYRTYNNWQCIIEELISDNKDLNIVLLGSRNATDVTKKIKNKYHHPNIIDCVNQFTFNQTAEIINRAKILLCCDGGLMHSANSVNTPIVALFAKLSSEMQLTEAVTAFSMFDEYDVNNITTEEVILNYKELAKLVYTDHQSE